MIKDIDNKLLGRREVVVRFAIQGPTPSRKQVMSMLTSALNVTEDRVVIREIKQAYVETAIVVTANVYNDVSTLKRVEYGHYLKRFEEKKQGQQAPTQEAK